MLDDVVELVEGSQAGALLAHPLTQHPHFPLSPWVTAVLAALAVAAAALLWPCAGEARAEAPGSQGPPLESWAGSLTLSQVAARVVSVILLGLVLAAGRGGVDDELENLAPALVIGVAWPGLVLATISLGPVWRWLDPWDAGARLVMRDVGHSSWSPVWPALLPAFAWVWYLSAYPKPLNPRSVGAILALYTLVTIAGCLALGRARWLETSEPFGIMLTWMARLRRGVLSSWRPPWGAEALLGTLIGGVLFGAARRSGLWG
ncbi:MAG: hypothetical protein M3442_17985, partial [Chloroflexota bacterium]|nr:hypothetical protein [Chloroflexota bacterium]